MRRIFVAVWIAIVCTGGAAGAVTETCREWQDEHEGWKARVLGLALADAPQRAIDEAVFELVQREAYLTSCPAPVEVQRAERIGWRLVGRAPDDYGSAVAESVLEQAGFPVDLRGLFDAATWPDRTRMAER